MKNNSFTIRYVKRQCNHQMMVKSLKHNFIKNGYKHYLNIVYLKSLELFNDYKDANKYLLYHLNQILPCIAFYQTLIDIYKEKDKAYSIYEKWGFDNLYRMSKFIRFISIFGLFRLIPRIFDKVIDKLFGEKAGFNTIKPNNSKVFSRDILVCPYYNTCKKYNVEEITKCFCKSDDITYSNIHPKLIWSRTKTIGRGDECCNFRLYLKDNK